jgi:hypothetical protein
MASPVYKDHEEVFMVDGKIVPVLVGADLAKDDTMAVVSFWRRDSLRVTTASFSISKAKKAGLWGKAGPWQEYPDRMLKMRARGFAGHDAFPDVLRGVRLAEELQDVPEEPDAPPSKVVRDVVRMSEQASAEVAL